MFGVKMSKKKVQPIWMEIDNRSASSYLLMPILIDQDYYAPLEVAYKYRRRFSKKTTRAQDEFFMAMHMPHQIPARAVSSGYVYALGPRRGPSHGKRLKEWATSDGRTEPRT